MCHADRILAVTHTRDFFFHLVVFEMSKLLSNCYLLSFPCSHNESRIGSQSRRDCFSMTFYLPFQVKSVDLFLSSSLNTKIRVLDFFFHLLFVHLQTKKVDQNGIVFQFLFLSTDTGCPKFQRYKIRCTRTRA